jgi:hypothetical protein
MVSEYLVTSKPMLGSDTSPLLGFFFGVLVTHESG